MGLIEILQCSGASGRCAIFLGHSRRSSKCRVFQMKMRMRPTFRMSRTQFGVNFCSPRQLKYVLWDAEQGENLAL